MNNVSLVTLVYDWANIAQSMANELLGTPSVQILTNCSNVLICGKKELEVLLDGIKFALQVQPGVTTATLD